MLGGGTFVTQNKVLPGSYINFVSAQNTAATMGERGYAALVSSLNTTSFGSLIIPLKVLIHSSAGNVDCISIPSYTTASGVGSGVGSAVGSGSAASVVPSPSVFSAGTASSAVLSVSASEVDAAD